jgi:sigma-B regulation protein RsbU (phosphoserine phosphatase)
MCQAGHPNPLLIAGNGGVQRPGGGGFPVGLLPNARFEDIEFSLRPGDRLICHSDGITECMDPRQQSFGTERLVRQLSRSLRRPLPESLAELRDSLNAWHGDKPFEDDISLLAIEFRPAPAEATGLNAAPDRPVPFIHLPPEPARTTP